MDTTTTNKVKDQCHQTAAKCQNDKVNENAMLLLQQQPQRQQRNLKQNNDTGDANDGEESESILYECPNDDKRNREEEEEEEEEMSKADSSTSSICSNTDSISTEVTDKQETYTIDMLPDEMLEFILTYMPPYKDLENCRLVCKRWNIIVKNFIRRTKINLHKGLVDYRLSWQVFSQHTAASVHVSRSMTPSLNNPQIIAGRFSHSAVRHGNSMYVFGGGSSSDTTFNDLWRFDLSEMRWDRPLSMGSYPSPKGSASLVSWGEKLVLFGGWRYPSLHPPYQQWCLFDELHYYDLKSNRWTDAYSLFSPPPLAGHSASVHGNMMVVFGGYQIIEGVNSNSNETWCLDLKEHMWWRPSFIGTSKPPARYGQYQMVLDETHLLIVGGCGGPNSVYSDVWLLDMSREFWQWKSLPVRNKKFAASHMWCSPACKIDSKLVVLGPTPNMPQDFQLMKQTRMPVGGGNSIARLGQNNQYDGLDRQQRPGPPANARNPNMPLRIPAINHNRPENQRLAADNNIPRDGPDEHYFAQRRAILNQHQQNANNNNFVNNQNHILQPRYGSLRDLASMEERNSNQNQASTSTGGSHQQAPRINGSNRVSRLNDNEANSRGGVRGVAGVGGADHEAANRLQRNLALRCRENEPLLPKRFDELFEDPFRMAAFNVQNRPRSLSKDHSERIRRMEEKMNALRNSRRSAMAVQKSVKEPSPKRAKRNVLSLFVCDLGNALSQTEPFVEWLEYKNYGIIPGAPERLILSTMVAGHGELILFGGVHKETLSEVTHQVSNTVHFLSAPREIV